MLGKIIFQCTFRWVRVIPQYSKINKVLTVFVLLDHPDLFLLKVELDVFEDLDFVLCEVGVLLEDFQVEELEELRLEHEGVVSDTDEAQGVEGV